MADVKISALPAATTVAATDVAPIVAGGTVTQKATAAQIVKGALDAAPVTVAQGGTGATTAAAAQTALNVPSRTGTGATGTWGISVTGTAQKATDLANGVAGDLPYQSGDTATEFLPIGTAGQVLTVVNGLPAWAAGGGGSSLSGVTQATTPFLTALGAGASTTATGLNNTFVGRDAGKVVTSGVNNTFIGAQAGDSVTTGGYNTAIGDQAAASLVGGSNNTVVGSRAMTSSTAGTGNTVIGREAGKNLTGDYNVIIGFQAGDIATTMGNSVLIGAYAGAVTTASSNNMVGVGYAALNNLTTGARNTAVGNYAGAANQISADNACFGDSAGRRATGANNTFLGSQSGVAVTTGANNTFVGKGAGSNVTTGGGNTVLGAYGGAAAMSGQVYIADGTGKARIHINEYGGIEYFDNSGTTGFGSFGQYLRSNSSTGCPAWEWPNTYGAQSTTTSIAVSITNEVTLIDCSINGNLTITLPTLDGGTGGTNGRFIILKRIDNTANIATLQPAAGQLIDGQATDTLHALNAVTLMGWGTNWVVLNGYISTQPSLQSPTLVATMAGNESAYATFTPVAGATGYDIEVNEL